MFTVNFHLKVYRYEIILAVIILFLTGSVVVISRERDWADYPSSLYPYSIALTFDDGPHPYFTDRILSQLHEHHARATFFLVGSQVEKYPYLVRDISSSGNEVASHTLTHRNLAHLTGPEVRDELTSSKRLLESITGMACRFYRPPGGQFNQNVIDTGHELGLGMVLWTVFPKDHEEENSDVILQRVLAQASDGGIVLLHSGRIPTLRVLPRIIRELHARGYNLVTVSELRSVHAKEQLAWLR